MFEPFVKSALCWIPPLLTGWLIARRIGSEPAEMFLLMDIAGTGALAVGAGIIAVVRGLLRMIDERGRSPSADDLQHIDAVFHNHENYSYEREIKIILLRLILKEGKNKTNITKKINEMKLNKEKQNQHLTLMDMLTDGNIGNIENDRLKNSRKTVRVAAEELFDEIILAENGLKLNAPKLRMYLSTGSDFMGQNENHFTPIYPVLMAIQTAYWFGMLSSEVPDTGGNSPTKLFESKKCQDVYVIFSQNRIESDEDHEPFQFNFLFGCHNELTHENSSAGTFRPSIPENDANPPINGIVHPFIWSSRGKYIKTSERKMGREEGEHDDVETRFEEAKGKSQLEHKKGFALKFTIDLEEVYKFLENFFINNDPAQPFRLHGSQVNTTYDRSSRSENVGIFMGLSVVDALYRAGKQLGLEPETNGLGFTVLDIADSKNNRRSDYRTPTDDGITVECKGHGNATFNTAFQTMMDGSGQVTETIKDLQLKGGFVTVTARKMKPRSKTDVDYHYFILEGIFKDEG